MPLTGEAALALMQRLGERNDAQEAALLAERKAQALARGKEPFDLARLETMASTYTEGRLAPEAERRAWFERLYYVFYEDLLTLEEFAAKVNALW